MDTDHDILTGITGHLASASKLITDSFQTVSKQQQLRYVEVSLQLAFLRQQLANPTPASLVEDPDANEESEDERIERKAAEAVRRVADMLRSLQLTAEEQAFSKNLGEQVVDMVTDAYVQCTKQYRRMDGACITAAIAVAMMIVHDEPDA